MTSDLLKWFSFPCPVGKYLGVDEHSVSLKIQLVISHPKTDNLYLLPMIVEPRVYWVPCQLRTEKSHFEEDNLWMTHKVTVYKVCSSLEACCPIAQREEWMNLKWGNMITTHAETSCLWNIHYLRAEVLILHVEIVSDT